MFEAECSDSQHGFVQNPFVFDDVGEDFRMSGPAGGGNLCGHALRSQGHNPVHGPHAFGAGLNTFHAARAIPHAAGCIEIF